MKKPRQFGNYWLLDRINVGGMAEVWKAKSFGSNGFERIVAIKRILPNIAEDKEFIDMFVDEAKISVQLTHPNIAQVTDLDKVDDQYYIAMEYIQGKDLRTIFEHLKTRHTPMDISQACFVTMKVCEGLDYAHKKKDNQGHDLNIVHRDVSPQNILISYEGDVKIIDFGIAKAAGKASQTQAGILKGKFGYMSPEQVRGLALDGRSDIFSLGIIFYELLTNERLFYGETDFSTLEKVRNVEILPPSAYNPSIPRQLESIILRALEKEREHRYQSAMEFHDELQAFMFANGWFYSRKDLADWMKREFKADIEKEKQKMDEYAQYTYEMLVGMGGAPRSSSPSSSALPAASQPKPAAAPANLSEFWDDDEVETAIQEKTRDGGGRKKAPPAAARRTLMGMGSPPQPVLPSPRSAQPDPLSVLDDENSDTPAGVPAEPVSAAPSARASGPQSPAYSSPADAVRDFVPASPAMPQPMPASAALPSAASDAAASGGGKNLLIVVTLISSLLLAGFLLWWFLLRKPAAAESELEIRSVDVAGPCIIKINDQVLQDAQGKPLSACSAKVMRPNGQYRVEIQAPGYMPYSFVVDLRANYVLQVQMVKALVKMYIDGVPKGASVQIDGKEYQEKTPWVGVDFAPGNHKIQISHPDFHPYELAENKQAGEEIRIQYALFPKKVTLTVPVATAGTTLCILQSPTEEPLPTQCQVSPNSPYVFEPQPNVKYYLRASKKDYKSVILPMNFEGQTMWSPPAVVALEKSDSSSPQPPDIGPVETPPMPPVVVVIPMDRPMDITPEMAPVEMAPVVDMTPPPMGGETGTLRLSSKPTAMIMVNGQNMGYTPKKLELPAGTHKVTLINNEQGLKKTITVTIKAGATVTEIVPLNE